MVCGFGQAIKRDKERELHEQTRCVANPIGTNDFDYEDKQKTEESTMVYEGLHFNLAAENSKNPFLISSVVQLFACLSNVVSASFLLCSLVQSYQE